MLAANPGPIMYQPIEEQAEMRTSTLELASSRACDRRTAVNPILDRADEVL